MPHKLRLKLIAIGISVLCPSLSRAQIDSLTDCFPLSIGNQWIYSFDHRRYDDLDPGSHVKSDTGKATYAIIGKIEYADSILWTFEQTRILHRWDITAIGPHIDSTIIDSTIMDTTTFVLVELRSGKHQLYRHLGASPYELLNYESGVFWNSVVPFQRDTTESSQLYRYNKLDSSSSLTLINGMLALHMDITVDKDSGISSLLVYSTAVLWWEQTHHQLTAQVIDDVPDRRSVDFPSRVTLEQNYPNQFNPNTRIEYSLSVGGHVMMGIYNSLGQQVIQLVDEYKPPGHFAAEFNGVELPSGIYIARVSIGNYTASKKIVLIR